MTDKADKKQKHHKEKEKTQEDYQKLEFRMYEEAFPKPEDLVMCKILKVNDDTSDVELLEYNGIIGMLESREVSQKKINYVKRLLKEGKEEVLRVLRVDPIKGYIDLSKKRVKPDESDECKEHYFKSKAVHQIMKLLSVKLGKTMEELYTQFCWPLYKKYGHAYIAFKEALVDDKKVFEDIDIDDDVRKALLEILKVRMVQTPVRIETDFILTCYQFEGIDAIKYALAEGEKLSTSEIPIKFKIKSSPTYECSFYTTNKTEGLKVLEKALRAVETAIKEKDGNFILQNKPKISGDDNEGKEIKNQICNVNNEGSEEEEEEKEEEQEEGINVDINARMEDNLD